MSGSLFMRPDETSCCDRLHTRLLRIVGPQKHRSRAGGGACTASIADIGTLFDLTRRCGERHLAAPLTIRRLAQRRRPPPPNRTVSIARACGLTTCPPLRSKTGWLPCYWCCAICLSLATERRVRHEGDRLGRRRCAPRGGSLRGGRIVDSAKLAAPLRGGGRPAGQGLRFRAASATQQRNAHLPQRSRCKHSKP